jgi:16S rRNA (uracil1498-N3)-methyltransferase
MILPMFYIEDIPDSGGIVTLGAEPSRHIIQVLRMKRGDKLELTDGKGNIWMAGIVDEDKKNCSVLPESRQFHPEPDSKLMIAISLLKNANRFEWFLEKATEIGVNEIIPLICERTEGRHLRMDRMKNLLVSGILQSRQSWLPKLRDPVTSLKFLENVEINPGYAFIAHCMDEKRQELRDMIPVRSTDGKWKSDRLILIGPEGDFTNGELKSALSRKLIPVSLGKTRLRTETAGLVAAAILAC